ncbi:MULTISPECIES: extracellular solute-binding protein [unclassified Caballeronia]|uniref:extracellular solute-binding protein n=1 Tax=unclassified Caballeronia TaxID=2646786 RepID=UPI0028555DB2|nr:MULTISPECIES: extracellular solute-binding protein [unclassified Caballeronia]MDR5815469.1 extracellular solute-binding protein [Caballeronia sp. LZ033]MDR5822041.1 extracellular solute-binding protein [Caballeronia sp. LZ043]MDR5880197.1 extracellular solute-binding protein [Caballeronia sp. LZ032]
MNLKLAISRRVALATAAVLTLLGATTSQADETRSITVLSWGLTWQTALQAASEAYTKKTGVKVNLVTQSSSGEGLVKLQAMKSAPSVDVWLTTSSVAERAVTDQQLFTPLPAAQMPNLKDVMPGLATPNYVALYSYPLSIVYRNDLVDKPITSWKELWDPRFAGKIAVPAMGFYQGRMLMIAANVGGKPGSADTGFDMLKKIKPNAAMFYNSDAQARQALAQGEVSVLIAPPSQAKRVADAGRPVKIVSPKGTPMNSDVAVLVRTPNSALAADYLNFLLSADINGQIAEKLNMSAINRKSTQPAALVDALPKPGDEMVIDEKNVNANIGAWTDRFNQEIAR